MRLVLVSHLISNNECNMQPIDKHSPKPVKIDRPFLSNLPLSATH